jgi:hypothetical protein
MALVIVIAFSFIFTLVGFSMLSLAGTEIMLTQQELNATRAFYAAEAGLARMTAKLYNNEFEDIADTPLGDASYNVDLNMDVFTPYVITTGKAGLAVKTIKAELSFLIPPYEHAVYAGNITGGQWIFSLRGHGDPQVSGRSGREVGGRDTVSGKIYVNGDVALYEESSINPSPMGNFNGDIESTGRTDILDKASVSGKINEGVPAKSQLSLVGMNYAVNNTHNVGKIFADAGVDWGYLPSDNELYDVMVKNPTNRSGECASTSGDDYFLEPSQVDNFGAQYKDAKTPLDLGDNRIYYVDGDVWIHSPSTYGFLIEGQVTIVATGDIHISDNIKYADTDSLLGLVALGKYDDSGQLISGGNIYFGDPRFGTISTVSALMFASDSFLYNTDAVSRSSAEPTSGVTIYGNLTALNQVSILRDWYTPKKVGSARSAYFDTSSGDDDDDDYDGRWVDMETGEKLSKKEVNSLRHYQMGITYDDRVRIAETQPPGLPKAKDGIIFNGLKHWEELPSS